MIYHFIWHNDSAPFILIHSLLFNTCTKFCVIPFFFLFSQRDDAAFDEKTRSTIKLNNGTILYLREVNKYLALVCILREDSFEKQGINKFFKYL